jgi:hypothetical protein
MISPAQLSWDEIVAKAVVRNKCKFLMSTIPLAWVRLDPGGISPMWKFIMPLLGIGKDQEHVVHALEDRPENLISEYGTHAVVSLMVNTASLHVFALNSTLMWHVPVPRMLPKFPLDTAGSVISWWLPGTFV